jgi:hypothetical protein
MVSGTSAVASKPDTAEMLLNHANDPERTKALCASLVRMKDSAIVGPDIAFAFTCPLPYHIKVEEADAPTRIGDHSGLLKFASYACNTRPPYSHHLGKKFLRQRKIGPRELVHPKEPFARSRLNRVEGIASRGLLDLSQEKLFVFH